jgi:predicted dehydrogenase
MEKLKVGIIGAGGIAQLAHIPSYQANSEVELTAISDINEEKLKQAAKNFNIPKIHTDWKELLEEDIDIVSICSPNAFHAQQSIEAMEKGKHVLCEKPVCLNSQDVEKIFRVKEKTGRKFMGAFCKRFSGEGQTLKKLVDDQFFGDIYYMKASYLRRRGIPGLGTWFTSKKLAGGGPMMDVGVHMIDLAIYLSGGLMPKLVVGSKYEAFRDKATHGNWPPEKLRLGDKQSGKMEVEDLACGFVKLSTGTSLFVEASWAGNSESGSKISIFGTKAGMQMPDPSDSSNPFRFYSDMGSILTDITIPVKKTNPYNEEINHFVNCVKENKETVTTKNEILSVVKIIEGIYKSAETGKPVIY